ncbi:MAG: isoleucine--tRNA ligase [Elusimicrobia bacterium]|nr:isoleucine--tRNA ligase [Elusimicrobiota bacterium]
MSYPVNLPQTPFSMKADLAKKEPLRLKAWQESCLYEHLQEARSKRPIFMLHDGPPYANGPIHMGHALNKILKDMVVRYKTHAGFRAPYVPGWDCHGLPIEQALLKELRISKKEAMAKPVWFRQQCRDFVHRMLELQRTDFIRLGVLGDWFKPYVTQEAPYTARIVEAFIELFQKGYIYQGLKTVQWCLYCETALAAAELEYQEKTSSSIFVVFPIVGKKGYSLTVWTTTPWTLPANRMVMVNPEIFYAAIELSDGRKVISAEALAAGLAQRWKGKVTSERWSAQEMTQWKVQSPLAKQEVGVYAEAEVSATDGSGLVHSAPGHGDIDFIWGRKHGIKVASPVDASGRFTDEAPWAELQGKRVDDPETTKELLRLLGHQLLERADIRHSYAHCWRCKNPVIFRATEQWFLNIEHEGLRERIVNAIDETSWLPEVSRGRIRSMVEQRPDWCLSRQRIWGAPIAILECRSCGEVNRHSDLFRAIVEKIHAEGEDFWFDPESVFMGELGKKFPCQKCGKTDFVRDPNILDVWMDSGVSWYAVLKTNPELSYPSDVYLEGSDQHRGWFQTSIITAVALTGQAPYKTVYTNGWVLDDQGRAMHKSLGNVVSPQQIIAKWGADVLRLWAASASSTEDVRISERLMELHGETYKKLRNTLRYMLGNLYGFNPQKDAVADVKDMEPLERWALANLAQAVDACRKHYENYDFPAVLRTVVKFTIHDLSNFYFDISKDRLYTAKADDPARRATQTVLFVNLHYLLTMLAPVLPFTAEEGWEELGKKLGSREPVMAANVNLEFPIFCQETKFPMACADWAQNDLLSTQAPALLELREEVHKQMDGLRKNGTLGSSLEAAVKVQVSPEKLKLIEPWKPWLASFLVVSQAEVVSAATSNGHWHIEISKAPGAKCARCWTYRESVGQNSQAPDLCSRCAQVVF